MSLCPWWPDACAVGVGAPVSALWACVGLRFLYVGARLVVP